MKIEAPRARGRAFQLTAEEVRAAPDVVAGMLSFMYLIKGRNVMLMLIYV